MKYKYVFMLGRPACGKSTLYRELEARILQSGQAKTFERADDFPILWGRIMADDARQAEGQERRHSGIDPNGNYYLHDGELGDILREFSADLLQMDRPDHVVFVEFARANYVEAIQMFDPNILEQSLVLYMQVSFETCWQRNLARHAQTADEGGDDHFLCREVMEADYMHDDRDELIQYLKERGIPVEVIDNEAEGEEHLKKQVEALLNEIAP